MYNESSSSDEYYENERPKKSRKRKPKKSTRQDVTWAEAAEIVLSKYDHPLQHKEILRLIEESNLKTMGRGNSAPLAVLNSMLNSHSKGPGATFYRATSGSACFGLTKHQNQNTIASTNVGTTETNTENKMKHKLNPPGRKLQPPSIVQPPKPQLAKAVLGKNMSSLPFKQLIPPGSNSLVDSKNRTTLGNFSQAAYDRLKQQPQHRRMGPTTSALVRPAPPCSRPPPGAALRVMPPKKRVKLDDDTDSDNSSKSGDSKKEKKDISKPTTPEKTSTLPRRESQRNQNKLISKIATNVVDNKPQTVKNIYIPKVKLKQQPKSNPISVKPLQHRLPLKANILSKGSNSTSFNSKVKNLQSLKRAASLVNNSSHNTDDQKNSTTFLGVKFKRMKKANLADQLKRSKEGKLDLMTPDSILTSVHIKELLNESNFKTLPAAYQYQLMMLLPDVDRKSANDGALRLTPHALNNGFFNRACQEFKDKLMDGEFNSDIIQRAKNEVELHNKLDPWKKKFFEPAYGVSSLDNPIADDHPLPTKKHLQPVETSWKVFLKFAENSTDDFEEALAKIQAEAQKNALKEAVNKEKDALEKKRKENLKRISLTPSSKLLTKRLANSPSGKSPLHTRSPVSLKPKYRLEVASKEKSRRALKKAQQLQRKKAFDKQLKDAKAKLVEEARFGARYNAENAINNSTPDKINDQTLKGNNNSTVNPNNLEPVIITQTNNITTNNENKTEKKIPPAINLCDSSALKQLIKKSDPVKSIQKTLGKKKTLKSTNSRIAIGPSTFGTVTGSVCPCNLKAMVICSECGSMWHGDCMNGTKICYICAT